MCLRTAWWLSSRCLAASASALAACTPWGQSSGRASVGVRVRGKVRGEVRSGSGSRIR